MFVQYEYGITRTECWPQKSHFIFQLHFVLMFVMYKKNFTFHLSYFLSLHFQLPLQDNSTEQITDIGCGPSQQANNSGSIGRLELEAGRLNPRPSTSSISRNSSDDLDRKLPAKKPRTTNTKSSNKDNRFLCSICLETVSDEPVVTRCGHLYCWTCLYQWLEPGILLSEYTAAFGAPHGASTASRGGRAGLNFLNEMSYSNVNASHRPYNPSGGRYNESRRCCPVCKADCTVDSVIPVYIHHSAATTSGESLDDESVGLGCMDECSNSGSAGSASIEVAAAAAAREAIDLPERGATAPRESPTLDDVCSSFDTDPTSNVGLRQRRRASPRQQNSPRQSTETTVHGESVFDSPLASRQFADNPASDRTNRSNNDTPIHRNGIQVNEGDHEMDQNATAPSVPSRPVPTSPWVTNRTLHPPTPPASAPQQFTEINDTAMGTSSPFRLALQPRRQPLLSSSPPRAYHTGTQHHSSLTSVLMGLVDTIDNLAASQSAGDTNYRQDTHNQIVPPLHRSDGGLGGIGRVSEQMDGNNVSMPQTMSAEESSLDMGREFLSRLLLMLACFVVLCLLLF